MKTKVKEISYEEFLKIKPYKRFKPSKPSKILGGLIRLIAKQELKDTAFSYTTKRLDLVSDKEPALILMNHSCFLDLKIAFKLLKNRRFNIVMTDDGFVGKSFLMRKIGCIPTMKFITDVALVKDMMYTVNNLHNSILLYPEASYSFSGNATPLPSHFAKLIKKLNIPVLMIQTKGAFLHDPLYNNLQLRKTKVSATYEVLLTKEEIANSSLEEINEVINSKFRFDAFVEQVNENIIVNEDFRADSINRILYKCQNCGTEHMMEGSGVNITCHNCNAVYKLEENGLITSLNATVKYDNPSKWYQFERDEVIKEIKDKTYKVEFDCVIYAMKDMKAIYKLGEGHLIHNDEGFKLNGLNGLLSYEHKVKESYSVYADFYWYEIDDIICIGNATQRYYCVPKGIKDVVAKIRIACEELFKMS